MHSETFDVKGPQLLSHEGVAGKASETKVIRGSWEWKIWINKQFCEQWSDWNVLDNLFPTFLKHLQPGQTFKYLLPHNSAMGQGKIQHITGRVSKCGEKGFLRWGQWSLQVSWKHNENAPLSECINNSIHYSIAHQNTEPASHASAIFASECFKWAWNSLRRFSSQVNGYPMYQKQKCN